MHYEKDPIGYWLNNVSRVPLLPAAETLRLATIIQDPEAPERKKQKCTEKLVRHNLRLIPQIVRKATLGKKTLHYGCNLTEDLFQVGVIGLTRAAQLFDPKLGYAFSTYAHLWIFQAVQREISKNLTTIRVPESALRDYYKAMDNRTRSEFIAHIAGDERLKDVHFALTSVSIESMSSETENGETDLHNCLCKEEDTLVAEDTFEEMMNVAKLTKRQKEVLRLTYIENLSFTKSGKKLNISRDSTRLVHAKAINALKGAIAS